MSSEKATPEAIENARKLLEKIENKDTRTNLGNRLNKENLTKLKLGGILGDIYSQSNIRSRNISPLASGNTTPRGLNKQQAVDPQELSRKLLESAPVSPPLTKRSSATKVMDPSSPAKGATSAATSSKVAQPVAETPKTGATAAPDGAKVTTPTDTIKKVIININQPAAPSIPAPEPAKPDQPKVGEAAKTGNTAKPETPPVAAKPDLLVKPTAGPLAAPGATPIQKFKAGVQAVVAQQKMAAEKTNQAAAAKTPIPNPSSPGPGGPPGGPPGGDPNAAMANATAMGMAYGGPLAGMLGPANAGALLQAQGDFKQLLDARTLPLTLMIPLVIALIGIILGFVVSVYYVILLIIMVIQQAAINAPLNIETVDYASIQSLTFFTPGQFNYTYFLLLPLVSIAGIGIFTALATVTNPTKPIPREIKGLVFIIGLSAVIMFFLQYLVYQKVGSSILSVEKRLKFFNTYVCTKVYKNSNFLKQLENPQASIVGVHNTMRNCLQMIATNTPEGEMAKAFFTLSMFYHYQKISLRNPIIFDAFNLFNTRSLLSKGCQPGAYLSRYGTYIEDISETLLRPQLSRELLTTRSEYVNRAFVLCNEWITNANGYANTIYPEDSFSSFVIMAIITILIQMIPLYLIIKFYQEGQDATSRILRSLMENLGVTATKAEQQQVRM